MLDGSDEGIRRDWCSDRTRPTDYRVNGRLTAQVGFGRGVLLLGFVFLGASLAGRYLFIER